MALLNFKEIISESMTVTKGIAGKAWRNLEPYAENEFLLFTQNAEYLATLKLSGQLTDEELKERLEIQRLALKNVLLAVEGMSLAVAQNIVNAVARIVFGSLSKALDIILPV